MCPSAFAEHRMLTAETYRLLNFGRAAAVATGGFAWLDSRGVPTPGKPLFLYVTCRMTHVYSLAQLLGVSGAEDLVDHGLVSLDRIFRDPVHGGWFAAVSAPGAVGNPAKQSYPHAFVVLAAASATIAGRPGAEALLEEALDVAETRFWDEDAGMVVEEWDESFAELSGYRGANSNMHNVEAYLAAYTATVRAVWVDRAERICARMVGEARRHHWRLPEHYDARWRPLLNHHADRRRDPFQPYGSTPGHALEWSRLLLHLRAAMVDEGRHVPDWLLPAARSLFDSAIADGWAVDGEPGLIYTVDWSGEPIIRQRLHWVLCEGLAAATALWKVTGEERFARWFDEWWAYAERYLIDREHGSWHHELNPGNRPDGTIRDGKADLYHAVQATLLPCLELRPSVAASLAD